METLRAGVWNSLPEIEEIQDPVLRDQVVEAWALALSETEFERIEDIPPTGIPGSPAMLRGTQADHCRGVATMALGLVDGLERALGPIQVNRDILIASGLLHDVGKPYEFSRGTSSVGAPIRAPWATHRSVTRFTVSTSR